MSPLTIIYLTILALALRPVWGHCAWWELAIAKQRAFASSRIKNRTEPGPGQWAFGLCYALVLLAAWPVALAVWGAWRLSERLPKLGLERSAFEAERIKKLKEMEQELGL